MDIVNIGSIATSVSETFKFKEENVVFLNTGDIYDGEILNAEEVTPMGLPGQAKKSIEENDILFSEIRPINRHFAFVSFKAPKYVVSTKLMVIRIKDSRILPKYLYYFLTSEPILKFLQVMAESRSGTFPQITFSEIKNIKIPVPNIDNQKSIIHCLDSINELIKVKKSKNDTLEEIAKALFKSWFVDFDPVQAKIEGHNPYGVDAETADLFPYRFVDTSLGEIPNGWSIKNLPDVIEINPQRSLGKGQIAPYLEMSNMPTSSARALSWEYKRFTSGMRFMNGDVLLARITPCLENGKTAYVDFLENGQIGWGSTEYIVFSSKLPLPNEYAYFLARSVELRYHAIQNMTGTSGRQRVPAECFNSYQIVVPSDKVAAKFGEVVRPLMIAMKQYDEESQILASIRNALLPKLLSGEIRVNQAEEVIEAVL